MRRVLIALVILAVAALPSFADDAAPQPVERNMRQHPEMGQEMLRNPEHLLLRAYHKNLMTFGHILAKVAREKDNVPPDIARTAVAEMRHSVEQIEKHRPMAMHTMPSEMQHGDMQKVMDQHLVDVKTRLTQLEDITRSNQISSTEVLKHLQPIFEGCQKMGCGAMHDRGMPCRGMHGRKGMGDCCSERPMAGAQNGCRGSQHCIGIERSGGPAMQEMVQKMKRQDTEMAIQVKNMQKAPRDKKVDLMAGIVAQLVQQRADFTSHIEKMQHHMMHNVSGMHQGCDGCAAVPPPPPGTPMYRDGDGPDNESDFDADDVETDEPVGY